MTDPFADLERELLAAHARGARPRVPVRMLALAATAAAAAAIVVAVATRSDPERAVGPAQRPAAPVDCDGGWQPPVTQDPAPPELVERFAFLEDGTRAEVDHRLPGAQAVRLYGMPVTMPHAGGYDVLAGAADIVPRAQVSRDRDPCAPPRGQTQPGVCMMLFDDAGGIGACFTTAEIDAGEAFVDVRERIVGLAPDGVGWAVAGESRAEVEGNVFSLPGGPETKVDFRP